MKFIVKDIHSLDRCVKETLGKANVIEKIAAKYKKYNKFLFIGSHSILDMLPPL